MTRQAVDLTDRPDPQSIDLSIGRMRIAVSLATFASMWADPMVGGAFTVHQDAAVIMVLHLCYSTAAYFVIRAKGGHRFAPWLTASDILFAAAVACFAEGATSPSYVLFCFAIVAVSCRQGLGATLQVTSVSIVLYLAMILFFHEDRGRLYLMRPAYLGWIGALAGFLGRERASFENRLHAFETAADRRRIASALHDGHVQALAAVNMRLQACRQLLQRGDSAEALVELTGLQESVAHEYDDVRSYIRSLADAAPSHEMPAASPSGVRLRLSAVLETSGEIGEQVLQILLEGLRNTLRHGRARSALLEASAEQGTVRILVEDDGVGLEPLAPAPWAIASRVADLGGALAIESGRGPGAHLVISLPAVKP